MASVSFYRIKSGIITVKFTLDRKNRFELSTGERIEEKFWDNEKQRAKSAYKDKLGLNQSLDKISSDLVQLYRDNKSASIADLKEMAKPIIKFGRSEAPREKKSLASVLELYIRFCESNRDIKTKEKFEGLLSKINEYGKRISIENTDVNFHDSFESFLYSCPNPRFKGKSLQLHPSGDYWEVRNDTKGVPIGLMDETVSKYFVMLKTFLAWAKERKDQDGISYKINPSFEKWITNERRYKPISLNQSELEQLEAADISAKRILELGLISKTSLSPIEHADRLAKALDIARDYLVMECRTGQRISDIKRFDISDYTNYEWKFYRHKGSRISEKQVTVDFTGFCAPALLVLAKHNFQMPKISEQRLNENIKRVCQVAGLTQEITVFKWIQNKRIKISAPKCDFISTHTGRKTFITIMLQYAPPKVVMDMVGITDYKTLKHYEDDSDKEVRRDYLNKVDPTRLLRKAQ